MSVEESIRQFLIVMPRAALSVVEPNDSVRGPEGRRDTGGEDRGQPCAPARGASGRVPGRMECVDAHGGIPARRRHSGESDLPRMAGGGVFCDFLTVVRPRAQARPMDAPARSPRRKLPLLPLAIATAAGIVAAVLLLRGFEFQPLEVRGIELIRGAGPLAFFGAMAILPSVGMPLLAFTIPAGEVFAPRLGLGGVIAISLAAIAFNLALSYWLARYALRPLVSRILERYGYRVPRATAANALSITLLVRLTPGPPYSVQCYLLGLAEVPFRTFMIVSWLCLIPWAVGAIVLGQGILNGNFKLAAAGLAVLTGAVLVVQRLRRKYESRPA